MNIIGDKIYNIRKKLRMNQHDFGKGIGLSTGSISDIENGKTPVLPRHIIMMAKVYKVNPDYLLHGIDPMFKDINDEHTHTIPSSCPKDEICREICHICMGLSTKRKHDLLRYARERKKLDKLMPVDTINHNNGELHD